MTSAQDFKTEIDQWLGSKDERTIRKIWQVVSALNTELQLRDEDTFNISYDKFKRERITNSKDLEVVLEILQKHTVIEVSKKIMDFALDPNKPHSFWDVEVQKIKMFETADTQVKFFPERFSYLRDALKEKVNQKDNKQPEKDNLLNQNQGNFSTLKTISCNGLNFSFINCHLNYKDGNPQTVSPETREMRFFLTLYKNHDQVIDYKDIARDIELESYKYCSDGGKEPHEKLKNLDFATDVGMLRRDFRKLVLSLGMPPNEFSKMIITVTKKGYQLVCEGN